MNLFLGIVIASLVEFVGFANFKTYARTGRWSSLAMGLVAHVATAAVIIQVLRSTDVMAMNLAWDGISALIATALAFFLLHETLPTMGQWSGAALIIAGLIGLSYGKTPTA